jgi:50S ribosomal protein L16 3-hydroxylase
MTYSIGMRAPKRGELATELAARLGDALDDETLYRDRHQPAARRPAAIPARLQTFAVAAVRSLVARRGATERVLGELLSEPKAHVWFERARAGWRPGAIVLDRRTRMLYDVGRVYINGDSVSVRGKDAALLRRLADERGLDARAVRGASHTARALLREWFAAGWLHTRSR